MLVHTYQTWDKRGQWFNLFYQYNVYIA